MDDVFGGLESLEAIKAIKTMRAKQLNDERLVSDATSSEAFLLGNERSIEDTASLLIACAEIEILEAQIAIPLHQPGI